MTGLVVSIIIFVNVVNSLLFCCHLCVTQDVRYLAINYLGILWRLSYKLSSVPVTNKQTSPGLLAPVCALSPWEAEEGGGSP